MPSPKKKRRHCSNPRSKPFPPERVPLRGVFFGTSDFAVPALRAFTASLDCVLVVTQPDRPAGRGMRLAATPVKRAAEALGLEVFAPERLRDATERLANARADVFAVASYGKLVPAEVLELPRLGALNVHPSLLPRYRGATPLQAQLRDGVQTGGVTIILMDVGMDTGDIVLQEPSEIGPLETYGELHDRFARFGGELLARAVAHLRAWTLQRVPQAGVASSQAIAETLTRPLSKDDLVVDWNWRALRIANHVRSLAPAPAARAELAGERVKLLSVVPAEDVRLQRGAVGSIAGVRGNAALVWCGDGAVAVERLVPPNRDALDGALFARARLTA
jgi:methionyl-tRNA formyltransferase